MLVGNCPECAALYTGWALKSPWYQNCERCGADLVITEETVMLSAQEQSECAGEPDVC